MKKGALILAAVLFSTSLVWAGGDLSRQTPVELKVLLGAKDNEFAIRPRTWNLETGKLYKVALVNEGKVKHEWVASEFALTLWTRKVQVGGVEVKGVINEIELEAGAKADWYFVPIRTGEFERPARSRAIGRRGWLGRSW